MRVCAAAADCGKPERSRMIVIVAVDDRFGMAFNHRRVTFSAIE